MIQAAFLRAFGRPWFGAYRFAGAMAPVIVGALIAAVWFAPALHAPPADANRYLAQASAIAAFDAVTPLHVYGELATRYHAAHPGWYPLAPLPLLVWLLDSRFPAAQILEYLLLIASFALFAQIARRLLGNVAAVVAAVLAICTWQFRLPHDPVIGSSLVVTWSATLSLLAVAAWLEYASRRGVPWLILCSTAFVAALLTGPAPAGIAVVLAIALLTRHRNPGAWWIAILLIVVGVLTYALRPFPMPWSHAGGYAHNVLAQLAGAIPSTYRGFSHIPVGRVPNLYTHTSIGWRFINNDYTTIAAVTLAGWIAVGLCTLMGFAGLVSVPTPASQPRLASGVVIGAAFWAAPAFVLGPPGIWQHGLPMGQAFDIVFFQYFGLALLLTVAILQLMRRATSGSRALPAFVALAIFIACYGNVRANATVIAHSVLLDRGRAQLERAGAGGLFGLLRNGSSLVVSRKTLQAIGLPSAPRYVAYAIFHYAQRRYTVVTTSSPDAHRGAWLLHVDGTAPIPVSLTRWSDGKAPAFSSTEAFGFATSHLVVAQSTWPQRGFGVATEVRPVAGGYLVLVRQLCGPVSAEAPFAGPRPTLTWLSGAYPRGPVGYDPGLPTLNVLADITYYVKMYLGAKAVLQVTPSACPPTAISFGASILAGGPGTLVASGPGRTYTFPVSATGATVVMTFAIRSRRPFRIVFRTDAPVTSFYPELFRYDRSFPHETRLMLQASPVFEERPSAARAK